MLILTRRIGEKLLIGDDIEVIVLDINRNQAKIGIKAPRELTVLREELFIRDKRESMGYAEAETEVEAEVVEKEKALSDC